MSFRSIWPNCAALLAEAYGLCGRAAEADAILTDPALDPTIISLTGMLAESCRVVGRVAEARDLGQQELELARARKARGREAWVCHLLGALAADRDHPDPQIAESHYRDAMAMASELGMRPLIAHCHLGLAKLCRRTAKPEKAREHLTVA